MTPWCTDFPRRKTKKEVQHSTVVSVLTGMSVFKHPGIIIRVYGFKIFVLKNGTARCSFS